MSQNIAHRLDIQFFRGISVLLVVFYHLNIPGFSNGYLGVDIFFVLSGFLMATLTRKVSVIEFYKRRLKRLLPAYLVVVFFTTLAVIFLTIPVDANQRIGRVFFDLVALSNFVFWAESPYFSFSAFKPLLNFWSLAVELQFYLLAPFLLPFLRSRTSLLTALACVSLIASMTIVTISPKTSFFMLPTRLWEFLFGAYAAWFLVRNIETKALHFLSLFSLVSVIIVIAVYPLPQNSLNVLTGHPSLAALIVVTATAALLVLRIDTLVPIDSWASKGLIKLGDYSYSVYLVHFPIIVLANYTPFGGTKLGFENISQLVIIIILTVVASYLLYNYVEKLRYSKKIVVPALGLTLSCFALGLFGSTINSYRYSEKEILIFNAWEDRSTYRCGKLNRIINPTSKICLLGEESNGRRILFLGDSHFDSIKTAFQNTMAELGNSTYFYVKNNPLMSDSTDEEKVKKEVLKNKIDSVVIHYNPGFFDENKYLVRLKSFLRMMEKSDISVFFIAPVPVYEVHVPRAMLSALSDPNFKFPVMDHSKYQTKSSAFFSFINEDNIDTTYVAYPHLTMCPSDECIYQKNGAPYYFDSNHLTLTGARELKPLFKDLFLQVNSQY